MKKTIKKNTNMKLNLSEISMKMNGKQLVLKDGNGFLNL